MSLRDISKEERKKDDLAPFWLYDLEIIRKHRDPKVLRNRELYMIVFTLDR